MSLTTTGLKPEQPKTQSSRSRNNKAYYNRYARELYKNQKYSNYRHKVDKVLESYSYKKDNSYECVAKQFRHMAYRLN